MPFALLFAGALLLAAGVHGQTSNLIKLVRGDIEAGYVYWLAAILVVGALGYVEELKPVSRAFMALIVVVLLLKAGNPTNASGGFFAQLQQGLAANPQPNPQPSTAGSGNSNTIQSILGGIDLN